MIQKAKLCLCGCQQFTKGGRFCPGHDAKLKHTLITAIRSGDTIAMDQLIDLGWGKFAPKEGSVSVKPVVKVKKVAPTSHPTSSIVWKISFTYCGRQYSDKFSHQTQDGALSGVCGRVARRMNRRSIQEGMTKLKIDPQEMKTELTDLVAEQLEIVDNAVLTVKDVMDVASSVIPSVVKLFYPSNRSAYRRLQFEPVDIEQHLWEKVALKRYTSLIERHPQYYRDINCLRKSFYMAAKNCCFAHHRMHIGSIMRGRILHCQVLELDHPESQSVGLASDIGASSDWSNKIERIISEAPDDVTKMMLRRLCCDHDKDRSELRRHMNLTESKFSPLWDKMVSYMTKWHDDLKEASERGSNEPTVVHVQGLAAEDDVENAFMDHADECLEEVE